MVYRTCNHRETSTAVKKSIKDFKNKGYVRLFQDNIHLKYTLISFRNSLRLIVMMITAMAPLMLKEKSMRRIRPSLAKFLNVKGSLLMGKEEKEPEEEEDLDVE